MTPKQIAKWLTEDPDILAEEACPSCGDPGAYVGFSSVECPNENCRLFVPPKPSRVERFKPKRGTPKYKCSGCKHEFKDLVKFKAHQKDDHLCPVCGGVYRGSKALQQHMQDHPERPPRSRSGKTKRFWPLDKPVGEHDDEYLV